MRSFFIRTALILLMISLLIAGVNAQNIALNKPATASSSETAALGPANAVDGNATTRWSSQFTATQWIYVDLGAAYNINRVVLNWEAAYGTGYQIQVSNNA